MPLALTALALLRLLLLLLLLLLVLVAVVPELLLLVVVAGAFVDDWLFSLRSNVTIDSFSNMAVPGFSGNTSCWPWLPNDGAEDCFLSSLGGVAAMIGENRLMDGRLVSPGFLGKLVFGGDWPFSGDLRPSLDAALGSCDPWALLLLRFGFSPGGSSMPAMTSSTL